MRLRNRIIEGFLRTFNGLCWSFWASWAYSTKVDVQINLDNLQQPLMVFLAILAILAILPIFAILAFLTFLGLSYKY